ncbi:MAG: M14 family metallopeptidase [Treponema sp.]
MKKVSVYELKALYRDNMRVFGWKFGSGEKSCVIAGGIRGNEIQQMFICAELVKALKELEKDGKIAKGKSILVVPVINSYSMNIEKRFWPTDNTDINRMFPGYALGETTQRIASGVFAEISGYEYGIQFASNYIPGEFVPHVRIMTTGYEDVDSAKSFGLPYIVLRKPHPYDTTTLHYNWQIWETKSFSIFTNQTETINQKGADEAVQSVLNFLAGKNIIEFSSHKGYNSSIINESDMICVKSNTAGIFQKTTETYKSVKKGELLANILNPIDCSIVEEIKSPISGTVFFTQSKSLAYANAVLFRIIPQGK